MDPDINSTDPLSFFSYWLATRVAVLRKLLATAMRNGSSEARILLLSKPMSMRVPSRVLAAIVKKMLL